MLLIPSLVMPFLFLIGVFRLYQLVRRFQKGQLQLNGNRGIFLPILTILAFITFAFFTASIFVVYGYILWALFLPQFPFAKILSIFCIVIGYPVIYFFAEWVFYYGLKPNEKGTQ